MKGKLMGLPKPVKLLVVSKKIQYLVLALIVILVSTSIINMGKAIYNDDKLEAIKLHSIAAANLKVKLSYSKATTAVITKIAKSKNSSRIKNAKTIAMVFPESIRADAIKVANCESSLVDTASNKNRDGSRDWGLFQLNDGGTLQRLGGNVKLAKDAEWNIKAAYVLYQDRGWQPWVCAKSLHLGKR